MLKEILFLISVANTLAFSDIFRDGSDFAGGHLLKGEIGWGNCPDVRPAEDINITGIYGKWYTVAEYSDPDLEGERCRTMEIVSGDEGNPTVPCRLNVTFRYIDTKTGKSVKEKPSFIFVADEDDQLSFTIKYGSKPGRPSRNWYPLATDYNNYLASHSCEEFPEGFPWPFRFYTQHNYINYRTPEGIPEEDFNEVIQFYANFGISFEPFVKIEPNCKASFE